MRFRRNNKYVHAEVQAGGLTDILFFLMLFFLIISTLASPSAIKLLLPTAHKNATVPNQKIEVSIGPDLKHYVNKTEVPLENLQEQIMQEASRLSNPTVVLKMDKSIIVDEMVKVIDIINQTKIAVVIAVDKAK